MTRNAKARLGIVAAIVVVLLVIVGGVVAPRLHIDRSALTSMMQQGGGEGGDGSPPPPGPTSIVFNFDGSAGDSHALSASVGTKATVSLALSDPNFKALYDLHKLVTDGNMTSARRIMYLHYGYADGSTVLYTLQGAYVSAMTTGTSSFSVTLAPQSITRS